MSSKKSRTLRFTLSAEYIENENASHATIGEFIMPLGADDLVCSVNLPGDILGEKTALAARIACQAIDVALKRHLERGGGGDAVEMLDGLHIDPMGDIQDGARNLNAQKDNQ